MNDCAIERIDVLQIDTEGHDHAILMQVPLRQLGVRVLHVELINVDPVQRLEVFETVRGLGYRCHYDGNDLTAVLDDGQRRADASGWYGGNPVDPTTEGAPGPIACPSRWIETYPRNDIPAGLDNSAFGTKLAMTSLTDTKIPAPFGRTTIRLPPVAFPASTGFQPDGGSDTADPSKFFRACQAEFSCGFSEPVAATGFLPDHALCIERGGELRLLEEVAVAQQPALLGMVS